MKWREAIKDPPTKPGIYIVRHPVYGVCEYGWNNGWGWDDEEHVPKPIVWLDKGANE